MQLVQIFACVGLRSASTKWRRYSAWCHQMQANWLEHLVDLEDQTNRRFPEARLRRHHLDRFQGHRVQ